MRLVRTSTAAENLQSSTSASRRRACLQSRLRCSSFGRRRYLHAKAAAILKSAVRLERKREGRLRREKTRRPVAKCATLLLAVCVSTVAIATRIHLTCITNKVIIIDTPTGSSSSNSKENLTFLIDEASKKISFADGVPLSIQRFDDRWISVTGGGVSYELDRESRSLSFAGTIMKEGTATIIIGAGRCSVGSDAR
jgi:hypothetical protein